MNPSTPLAPRAVAPTPTDVIIVDAMNATMPAYVDTGLNLVPLDQLAIADITGGQGPLFTCENIRNELGFAPRPAMQALRDAIH